MFYTNDPDYADPGKIELLEEGKYYFCPYIELNDKNGKHSHGHRTEMFTIMPFEEATYDSNCSFKVLRFKGCEKINQDPNDKYGYDFVATFWFEPDFRLCSEHLEPKVNVTNLILKEK